jgi:hypothetical protein
VCGYRNRFDDRQSSRISNPLRLRPDFLAPDALRRRGRAAEVLASARAERRRSGLRQGSVSRWSWLIHAIKALGAGLVLAMTVVAPAAAYIGPGAGLSAIGLVLAMIAALGLAVVGFVWYPLKRLLRRRATAGRSQDRKPTAQAPTRD